MTTVRACSVPPSGSRIWVVQLGRAAGSRIWILVVVLGGYSGIVSRDFMGNQRGVSASESYFSSNALFRFPINSLSIFLVLSPLSHSAFALLHLSSWWVLKKNAENTKQIACKTQKILACSGRRCGCCKKYCSKIGCVSSRISRASEKLRDSTALEALKSRGCIQDTENLSNSAETGTTWLLVLLCF